MVTNLSIPIATILGGDFNSTFAMPLTLQAILPVNRYNVVHGVAYSHDHYQVIALTEVDISFIRFSESLLQNFQDYFY